MQGMTALPLVQCCAPLAEPGLTEDEAGELERVFKALQACGEAVCVCYLEDLLPLKQPTVSYHLKQLLEAGIVEREKRGSFAYFSVADGALEHVCALLGYDGCR